MAADTGSKPVQPPKAPPKKKKKGGCCVAGIQEETEEERRRREEEERLRKQREEEERKRKLEDAERKKREEEEARRRRNETDAERKKREAAEKERLEREKAERERREREEQERKWRDAENERVERKKSNMQRLTYSQVAELWSRYLHVMREQQIYVFCLVGLELIGYFSFVTIHSCYQGTIAWFSVDLSVMFVAVVAYTYFANVLVPQAEQTLEANPSYFGQVIQRLVGGEVKESEMPDFSQRDPLTGKIVTTGTDQVRGTGVTKTKSLEEAKLRAKQLSEEHKGKLSQYVTLLEELSGWSGNPHLISAYNLPASHNKANLAAGAIAGGQAGSPLATGAGSPVAAGQLPVAHADSYRMSYGQLKPNNVPGQTFAAPASAGQTDPLIANQQLHQFAPQLHQQNWGWLYNVQLTLSLGIFGLIFLVWIPFWTVVGFMEDLTFLAEGSCDPVLDYGSLIFLVGRLAYIVWELILMVRFLWFRSGGARELIAERNPQLHRRISRWETEDLEAAVDSIEDKNRDYGAGVDPATGRTNWSGVSTAASTGRAGLGGGGGLGGDTTPQSHAMHQGKTGYVDATKAKYQGVR